MHQRLKRRFAAMKERHQRVDINCGFAPLFIKSSARVAHCAKLQRQGTRANEEADLT